jgi:asparagine synthetase B (glutamine-hydrolysing)
MSRSEFYFPVVSIHRRSQPSQRSTRPNALRLFSIGFEEDSFDESKYARRVAKHLNTEHYEDKLSATTGR